MWIQKLVKLRIKFIIVLNILVLQEFNKFTAENLAARLKEANLLNKTDFDNKLTSLNKRITLNKIKHLEYQKKLNSLVTKDYNFFLDRIYLQVIMDLKTHLFINQHLN